MKAEHGPEWSTFTSPYGWRYFRRARAGPRGARSWEWQVAGPEWWAQSAPNPALPWWPTLTQAFDHRPSCNPVPPVVGPEETPLFRHPETETGVSP